MRHRNQKSKSQSRQRSRSRDKKRKRSKERSRDRQERKRQEKKQDRKRAKFTQAAQNLQTQIQASVLSSKLQQNLYGSKEQVKNLPILQRLSQGNKSLGIGMTLVPTSSGFPMGLNTSVFSLMTDASASKIKRKIALPKDTNVNFSGLLIGPKGNNQKQLQQRTGCKIVVRGKGSAQSQGITSYQEQDLHVLVLGDNETQVAKACAEIQRIIFADQQTLNRIKQEQTKQYQQGITEGQQSYDLSLTTPYGPPSENAYILEVPNESVGLVIGKDGQTIKNIARKAGAIKVQIATSSAPGSLSRNVFVEGDPQSVQRVRKELLTIIEAQRKMSNGVVAGSHRMDFEVPSRLIGLIIGRNGQTIKGINAKTGAFVCLNKQSAYHRDKKTLTIAAKYEIQMIVQNGLKNLQRQGVLSSSELEMIKPITPISQQLSLLNLPIPTQNQTIREDPTLPYFLSQGTQAQIPSSRLFQQFLGTTQSKIEETDFVQSVQVKKKKRFS